MRNTKAKQVEKIDIKFIKDVAARYNLTISDEDAKRAHNFALNNGSHQDYYDTLKHYFLN